MYIQKSMKVIVAVVFLSSLVFANDGFTSLSSSFASGMFTNSDPIPAAAGSTTLAPVDLEGEVDSLYIVGPGDYFDVYMEDKAATVQVSPDGKIGLKQAGVIQVGGMTLKDARKTLLEAMAKVYLGKECFVKISQMKTFRIGVYGAVLSPGQHSVTPGSRLSLILRHLGGFQATANADSIMLIRKGDTTLLHYAQSELSGVRDGDPFIQQGDMIVVPEYPPTSKIVLIRLNGLGRALPWVDGLTADQYLQRSFLLRNNKQAFTHLNIQDMQTSKARLILMSEIGRYKPQANEILEPVMETGRVHIGGAVARMGSMPYNPSWTPYEYVANSGLLYTSVKYGSFRVVHKDGREEWMDPAKGVIEPGDFIEIPRNGYEETKDVALFLASIIGVLSTTILVYVTWKSTGK